MFKKNHIRVWVGILALSGMFLMGQDFWIEASDVRYVFVTDLGSTGNVPIEIADEFCQMDADEWGLPGTYKAWLSDSYSSPDTTFDKGGHPYRLPSGLKLAEDWDDLTDGYLPYKIAEYADRTTVALFKPVWTNTSMDGTAANTSGYPGWDSCDNWSSDDINDTGIIALVGGTNWSNMDFASCDLPPYPHYFCFGQ
jgi:hypothetical protein